MLTVNGSGHAVTNAATGGPAAGVTVTFAALPLVGHPVGCTATSSAAAVATCTYTAISRLLFALPTTYTMTAPAGTD